MAGPPGGWRPGAMGDRLGMARTRVSAIRSGWTTARALFGQSPGRGAGACAFRTIPPAEAWAGACFGHFPGWARGRARFGHIPPAGVCACFGHIPEQGRGWPRLCSWRPCRCARPRPGRPGEIRGRLRRRRGEPSSGKGAPARRLACSAGVSGAKVRAWWGERLLRQTGQCTSFVLEIRVFRVRRGIGHGQGGRMAAAAGPPIACPSLGPRRRQFGFSARWFAGDWDAVAARRCDRGMGSPRLASA